jgi:hypothetical protein
MTKEDTLTVFHLEPPTLHNVQILIRNGLNDLGKVIDPRINRKYKKDYLSEGMRHLEDASIALVFIIRRNHSQSTRHHQSH